MTAPTTPATVSTADALFSSKPSFAELYERMLVGPLFTPWAERLLTGAPLGPGARVLDVACGTGIVARLAYSRLDGQGHVVGVDKSPMMLAVARTIATTIDWREGDAAELPLRVDERFDVAFCHQGVQFFPDRLAAMRSVRAALVPGGAVAVGVWRSLADNSVFNDLGRVAERFLGPIQDMRHSFPDAGHLAQLLSDAGFTNVKVAPLTIETRFDIPVAVLVRLNAAAVVGMSGAKSLSDAERANIIDEIVDASVGEITHYVHNGVLVCQTSANVATARA
jgi:ubiquinone/menaquinone biosynthesis C-methylase UbiE